MTGGTGRILADSSFVMDVTRSSKMAGWRQVVELAMSNEEVARLAAVSRSRTEPGEPKWSGRKCFAYRENPSFFAAARRVGGHHQTVQRCVSNERWPMAPWWRLTTDRDLAKSRQSRRRPRLGWSPLACDKAKRARVSARAVDHAPAGPPCARAWAGGRTPLPGQAGSGHRLQDLQPGGNQAAQGALLPGVPGRRV